MLIPKLINIQFELLINFCGRSALTMRVFYSTLGIQNQTPHTRTYSTPLEEISAASYLLLSLEGISVNIPSSADFASVQMRKNC